MHRCEGKWIEAYQDKKAFWMHSGDNTKPHALLTSRKHSNGFFNSRLIIADEPLLNEAAADLLEMYLKHYGGAINDIDGVVGPQTGATKLAKLICQHVVNETGSDRFYASPAKYTDEDGVKSMVFTDEDLLLLAGNTILLCEDVVTTGGSIGLTAEAAEKANATVMPYIVTLVNRSGQSEIDNRKIISLISKHMPTWAEEECPLCKTGSQALPAKDNWNELNK
ncbi:MAG: hypothetical protein H6779_02625 [Candidatus Nomurabacteria bacterium]|nr:hypothetical protein [Candidatus Nomurabacteria bacterium]USN87284.1 MAG: hypothetical protein H6779_02625 [Candidatus Nomurabacteria bacterium]